MSHPDYPRWDERYATTLVSDDEVFVETEAFASDDDAFLIIRRTVWKKAYRAKDRHIFWTGDVAFIPRNQVPAFARDIVSSLI